MWSTRWKIGYTCNQVRELFLERDTIFKIPIQLVWFEETKGAVDDLHCTIQFEPVGMKGKRTFAPTNSSSLP